ncbi:hypothetical protein FJ938_22045 [Mesorhizobium sp. B2-4-14]|uniref:hypothetical protein n=1 Tax=Mesorhizobium sp. B2-4-14 TaxID=2589935 RepID=UPI00112811BE|nr:hypothetical protein [Mesorhizobium sp. B2-4-14]TPL00677.1 hypothetical protein FJ938_22045 [Mesorhizobium sp. B2-4-14]
MILDRDLQLTMLRAMADVYPEQLRNFPHIESVDRAKFFANLQYLCEHDLVDATWSREIGSKAHAAGSRITAKGMDFLADDGGLSAILGVVTIRFHEDTVKALLIDRVDKSDASPSVRSKLVEQIKALPAEATKALTLEAIKAGLANVPEFLTWVQSVLPAIRT